MTSCWARDIGDATFTHSHTTCISIMMWLLIVTAILASASAQFGTPGNPGFLGIPAPAYIPGQENIGFQNLKIPSLSKLVGIVAQNLPAALPLPSFSSKPSSRALTPLSSPGSLTVADVSQNDRLFPSWNPFQPAQEPGIIPQLVINPSGQVSESEFVASTPTHGPKQRTVV